MKNIGILVQNLHGGGAERVAANMSIAFACKYNVYLIVFDGQNINYEYGGKLIDLGVKPSKNIGFFGHFLNFLRRVKKLKKLKKQLSLDCCISHMENSNLVNIFAKNKKCRIISVFHDMPSQYLKRRFYNILIHKFISKKSFRYVVVSKLGKEDMVNNFKTVKTKTICIYNFIDEERIDILKTEEFDYKTKNFYQEHDFVLLNVGRLSDQKAQIHILNVLSKLREKLNVGLVILGDGCLKADLVARANELNISNHVFFAGEVRNPFSFMHSSDLFVLSSIHEGLPMVLIEAAQCGIPIVSTDMESGAREILAPNTDMNRKITSEIEIAEYGVLVPVMDVGSKEEFFYEAIYNLLMSPNKINEYRKKSKQCAERFYKKIIIDEWEKII